MTVTSRSNSSRSAIEAKPIEDHRVVANDHPRVHAGVLADRRQPAGGRRRHLDVIADPCHRDHDTAAVLLGDHALEERDHVAALAARFSRVCVRWQRRDRDRVGSVGLGRDILETVEPRERVADLRLVGVAVPGDRHLHLERPVLVDREAGLGRSEEHDAGGPCDLKGAHRVLVPGHAFDGYRVRCVLVDRGPDGLMELTKTEGLGEIGGGSHGDGESQLGPPVALADGRQAERRYAGIHAEYTRIEHPFAESRSLAAGVQSPRSVEGCKFTGISTNTRSVGFLYEHVAIGDGRAARTRSPVPRRRRPRLGPRRDRAGGAGAGGRARAASRRVRTPTRTRERRVPLGFGVARGSASPGSQHGDPTDPHGEVVGGDAAGGGGLFGRRALRLGRGAARLCARVLPRSVHPVRRGSARGRPNAPGRGAPQRDRVLATVAGSRGGRAGRGRTLRTAQPQRLPDAPRHGACRRRPRPGDGAEPHERAARGDGRRRSDASITGVAASGTAARGRARPDLPVLDGLERSAGDPRRAPPRGGDPRPRGARRVGRVARSSRTPGW